MSMVVSILISYCYYYLLLLFYCCSIVISLLYHYFITALLVCSSLPSSCTLPIFHPYSCHEALTSIIKVANGRNRDSDQYCSMNLHYRNVITLKAGSPISIAFKTLSALIQRFAICTTLASLIETKYCNRPSGVR